MVDYKFAGQILAVCIVLSGGAKANEFPNLPIPPSDRVLTIKQVKNFWVNTVRKLPIPRKPNSLHPKAQERWRHNLVRRRTFIHNVKAGTHNTRAELAQLEHNIEAWKRRGKEKMAEVTAKKLFRLKEHLARLEVLKTQQKAALAQIETLEKLRAIEAERSALHSSCSHACCRH